MYVQYVLSDFSPLSIYLIDEEKVWLDTLYTSDAFDSVKNVALTFLRHMGRGKGNNFMGRGKGNDFMGRGKGNIH